MVILALLLLGLGIAACVIVAIQVTDPITVSLLGTSIDTSAREIFFGGVITGAVMAAALWLLKSSTARAHRRRQEMKDLRRHRRTEVERLEAEKAELQGLLDHERSQSDTRTTGTPTNSAPLRPSGPPTTFATDVPSTPSAASRSSFADPAAPTVTGPVGSAADDTRIDISDAERQGSAGAASRMDLTKDERDDTRSGGSTARF